jgi:hypothetical protein
VGYQSQAVSNTWIALNPLHAATVPQQSVTELRRSETLDFRQSEHVQRSQMESGENTS